VLGTLVLQGLTLRPLILRLNLDDDDTVEREVRLARIETLRSAVAAAVECPGAETAELVRHRYELQLRRAEGELARREDGRSPEPVTLPPTNDYDADVAVVRAATGAQRQRLLALRADGTIGDVAFQRIEEELDRAELDWASLLGADERIGKGP